MAQTTPPAPDGTPDGAPGGFMTAQQWAGASGPDDPLFLAATAADEAKPRCPQRQDSPHSWTFAGQCEFCGTREPR